MYGAYSAEKAEARSGPRLGRAADRPGRRVRLLRVAGDQGAARRRHLHGPRQPEHRHHPDEHRTRRSRSTSSRSRRSSSNRSSSRKRSTPSSSSFGGQTALNCGLALDDAGVLDKYGVRVLGTPIEAIRDTEDRDLFCRAPRRDRRQDRAQPGVPLGRGSARGRARNRLPGHAARRLRARRQGQRHRRDRGDLDAALRRAFAGGVRQVLVEECLRGWKEIEYEVVRDGRDNCITVCNMENFDPMGIHTGESIVVAPSQTLNDDEYQLLRSIAIKTVRHLGIVGECNIQYALDPAVERLPRHRGQRAPVALLGARQQGDGLSARLRRGQDRARLRAPRDPERHHAPHDRVLRAGARLPRLQGAALGPRQVPGRVDAHRHRDEERRRGHGHRPHVSRGDAEGAAHARHRRARPGPGRVPVSRTSRDQLQERDPATASSPSPRHCATA